LGIATQKLGYLLSVSEDFIIKTQGVNFGGALRFGKYFKRVYNMFDWYITHLKTTRAHIPREIHGHKRAELTRNPPVGQGKLGKLPPYELNLNNRLFYLRKTSGRAQCSAIGQSEKGHVFAERELHG